MEYRQLVSDCLHRDMYPVLRNHVIVSIYYKMLQPKSAGTPIHEDAETTFSRVSDDWKNCLGYIFMTAMAPDRVFIHKEDTIDVKSLPLQCRKVRIQQGFLNHVFDENFKYFEQEINMLIMVLNTNPAKVKDVLGITFVDATRFIPNDIKMHVPVFVARSLRNCSCGDDVDEYFGMPQPTPTLFQPRLLDGWISESINANGVLSLNNYRAWLENERNRLPDWVHDFKSSPYCVHLVPKKRVYIPLAYNPFENPFIMCS